MSQATLPAAPAPRTATPVVAALLALLLVGSLVSYKASSALRALDRAAATHALAPKVELWRQAALPSWARPIAASVNYLSWVMIALAFGVLLGAVVRALFPDRWLARTLGRSGWRGQLLAAATATPLMLCSCCVAPLFDGVYARTRRLGPALGLMLAAPALNPAAIALTFLLFPLPIGLGRLVCALALVLVGSAVVARFAPDVGAPASCAVDGPAAASWRGIGRALAAGLVEVTRRSLPAILLGVVASALVAQAVPLGGLAHLPGGAAAATALVALVAVPIAMPTFAEIPIAMALRAAGAPSGAVLALLVAGPTINLPSLLTLRRAAGVRAAVAAAVVVFAVATAGGLLLGA
jgi:uncharacterized membrane protein YraQ (UPF0718 family)